MDKKKDVDWFYVGMTVLGSLFVGMFVAFAVYCLYVQAAPTGILSLAFAGVLWRVVGLPAPWRISTRRRQSR